MCREFWVADKGLEEMGGLSMWSRVESYPPSPSAQTQAHNGGTIYPLICTEVAETPPPIFITNIFYSRLFVICKIYIQLKSSGSNFRTLSRCVVNPEFLHT